MLEPISAGLIGFLHSHLLVPLVLRFFKVAVKGSDESLSISFTESGRTARIGNDKSAKAADVHLTVYNACRLLWRLVLDSRVGLAEAYMEGEWDADPSPKHLLTLLIRAKQKRNSGKKEAMSRSNNCQSLFERYLHAAKSVVGYVRYFWDANGKSGVAQLLIRIMVLFLRPIFRICVALWRRSPTCARRNTIIGSRENIRDHYDLGNDLFRLFLDESMTYSCPILSDRLLVEETILSDAQMLAAQNRKLDAILDQMDLRANDRVLEIGCGWGSLALAALHRQPSCHWHGLTLSSEQLDMARQRVKEANLSENIRLELADYREVSGTYDKVVAVEMIEAVGHDFLPFFFRLVADRVCVGGKVVIQSIICPDETYDVYRRSEDFIKKHIFPGGHMPSLSAICGVLPQNLKLVSMRRIGRHYPPALDAWTRKWLAARHEICGRLGHSQRFFRKWEMYFSLCSALFEYGNIDDVQLLFVKI